MMNDTQLHQWLRSALPPTEPEPPARDLWPAVLEREHAPVRWSWVDCGLAAALVSVLAMFPDWLWLLAYHL